MSTLYDRYTRHQVYLEGFKAGAAMSFTPFLDQIEDAVRREFSVLKVETFGDLTKAQLAQLISVIKGKIDGPFIRYSKAILAFLKRFMRGEISLFGDMLEDTTRPDAEALWTAILNAKLPSNGQLIPTMLKALAAVAVQKITDTIYKAAANSTKVSEALAALVGEPTTLFGGSVVQRLGTQNALLMDTVVQHISQMTSAKVASSKFDTFTYVSVIDKGTTDICRDRNGNVYKYSDGPLPPAHYGCRANAVPGDETGAARPFALWLKDQPIEVRQDMNLTHPRPLSLEAFTSKIDLILA